MTATAVHETVRPTRSPVTGIPTTRVVAVELRKMFDTRSGFWLMASIVITAVLASAAVVLFAPDSEVTYDNFAAAIGVPMTIVLPIVAILSVTSEWSQRSGLTTFTLVPRRGRVVGAKAVVTVLVAVASMVVAFSVGAVGNLVGSALNGTETVWDMSLAQAWTIPTANVLGMLLGFAFGLLLRSSSAAIVAYLVYAMVLPPLAELLATTQSWFADLRPWVDFNFAHTVLFEGAPNAEQWANLATSTALWVGVPLALGLVLLRRSEVK
jgi:ABC-2 type transport system permease protein